MTSSFDPRKGEWQIDWPGRVARHDLVYATPPEDPMQGIPLGNGDTGALAWCEGSRLVFALNKCDLWDDAPFAAFHNWSPVEEERSTTLRHAGRLVVDVGLPVFDIRYLSDFHARLSLADARMSLRAAGPFGTVAADAFVAWENGLLWLTVETSLVEEVPLAIRLERFGSRTFSHWYALVNRDARIGLSGTSSCADAGWVCVSQELSSGTFALGCRLLEAGALEAAFRREHSRSAVIEMTGAREMRATIAAAVSSPIPSPVPSPAAGSASALLRTAIGHGTAAGREAALASHRKAWKAFWLRSLMESGDDYRDNLWHLTMYYACASQRGAYPGRFINGLWTWNGDVQNWNFYFHWNQQQIYWPLNAAGHHDLVEGYLRYRFDSLAFARADARRVQGASGAWVSDVADRRGCNSASESGNHTPVAQIAMDFWRQYLFTGDERFLKERALPYLLEAARFIASVFDRGADGKLHARDGTGYEGWIRLKDAVSELVYGRTLLTAALAAIDAAEAEEPESPRWRELLRDLAPLPVVEAPAPCFRVSPDGSVFARGFFKGEPAPTRRVFAAGWGIEENRYLSSWIPVEGGPPADGAPKDARSPLRPNDPFELLQLLERNASPYSRISEDLKVLDGIFPSVEFSAIYPSGLIGLSEKDSELFAVAVATAKLYAPDCMGWDPLPIALARLGRGGELRRILEHWPRRWQFYCNGFGHYGPRDIMKADAGLRFRTTAVKDAANPEAAPFPFPAWPFRHMGMESMSVLAAAMNEALLQSHDGIVRVAPACDARTTARFTLHAVGGFVVSSEILAGRPGWVAVTSLRGGPLRMENPWERCHVVRNGTPEGARDARVVECATGPGDRLLLAPDRDTWASWQTVTAQAAANAACKTDASGFAMLGLPRMF